MKRLRVPLLAVLLPGVAAAGVVWRGDFETGNISQFSRAQSVSADRLLVVSSPVREGKYALKATVRQGDNPINASGHRNELVYLGREAEGSEYYYRWSTMFAADFPSANTWQVFTQWHHTGCCGSPPVEFFVKGEEIRLTLTDSVTPWKTKLVRGQWQDFIFHVKWSPDPKVGFVELWHNGKLVLPRASFATMYAGQGIYLKQGLYRSDTVQPVGVVYHDGFTQATELTDVLPPTQPPPPADAGTPDAGTPDAGAGDAGTPGTPDAGMPDAGAPDAGTSVPPGETGPPVTDPPQDDLPVEDAPPQGTTTPPPGTGAVPDLAEAEARAGCSSAGGPLWLLTGGALAGLLRRMRRR